MSNDLCEDLIVEIFSWVPVKSLLRFRSVSKSLRARIGSPDFIRLHTLRSPKKINIIHLPRYKRDQEKYKSMYTIHSEGQLSSYDGITPVEYPFKRMRKFCGSSNGILCVYVYEDYGAFHLWNPSIRRKATVHELPSWGRSYAHGFWFDPVINDYKIVRTSKADGTFVYTMKTRTWREIASPSTPINCHVKESTCLFDGALHWIVGGHSGHDYLMTFDLTSEVFSAIELPEPSWDTIQVAIIKGCLAVVSSKDDRKRIWARNTASGSWFLAFERMKDEIAFDGGLLAFGGCLLLSIDSEGVKVYNPATKVRSRLEFFTPLCVAGMVRCIESLELLHMGTPCELKPTEGKGNQKQ